LAEKTGTVPAKSWLTLFIPYTTKYDIFENNAINTGNSEKYLTESCSEGQ